MPPYVFMAWCVHRDNFISTLMSVTVVLRKMSGNTISEYRVNVYTFPHPLSQCLVTKS